MAPAECGQLLTGCSLPPPLRYLACDKYGILSATSEAVSPLESFVLVPSDPDATAEKFRLLTLRDTYIAVKEPSATKAKTGRHAAGHPWRR